MESKTIILKLEIPIDGDCSKCECMKRNIGYFGNPDHYSCLAFPKENICGLNGDLKNCESCKAYLNEGEIV